MIRDGDAIAALRDEMAVLIEGRASLIELVDKVVVATFIAGVAVADEAVKRWLAYCEDVRQRAEAAGEPFIVPPLRLANFAWQAPDWMVVGTNLPDEPTVAEPVH